MKKSFFSSTFATFCGSLLLMALISTGCDSSASEPELDQQPDTFSARISTDGQTSTLQGSAAMGNRGWDGQGGIFTVSDDFCATDDHPDTDYTFFTIELMPTGDNPQQEAIYFFYEGDVPQPGTYEIVDDGFSFDSTATDVDFPDLSNKFVASYSRMPSDNVYEHSFAKSGTLTITEITEEKVTGSFNFESDMCYRFTDSSSGNPDDFSFEEVAKDLQADGDFSINLVNHDNDGDSDGDGDGDGGGDGGGQDSTGVAFLNPLK